jgi:hypothetical protein
MLIDGEGGYIELNIHKGRARIEVSEAYRDSGGHSTILNEEGIKLLIAALEAVNFNEDKTR